MVVEGSRHRANLGETLVRMQIITPEQLQRALEIQQEQGGRLSEIIISQGFIRAGELASLLSIIWHVPLVDLKTHFVTPEALKLVPEEIARKHTLIPLSIMGETLVVVMADPDDYIAVADVFTLTNMKIEVAYTSADDIRRAIDIYYRSSEEIQEKVSEFVTPPFQGGQTVPGFIAGTPLTESLDLLIEQAVRDRASDIHLEPQEDRLRVRYRIDGVLHDVNSLPVRAHAELVSRIKILAGMDVTLSRQPQDGQFSFTVGDKNIDIRVASTDTVWGERVTLRLLDKSLALFTLPELGFLPEIMKLYRSLLDYPFGLVLAGGPTGSGKTTTLYTSINELDRTGVNIMTIEDPVEYRFADISQSQVDPKAGVTFAGGLRAMLRQDPDVILVGEIRDRETAVTAVQAAITGHLVFSSIHASDSLSMLARLIDLGVEPPLVASSVIGLVAQRMVRRICANCRTALEPSPAEREIYYRETRQDLPTVFKGTGCQLCAGTGYHGRTGIFELLVVSREIQRMLVNNDSVGELREQAAREGMLTMKQDGMVKISEGITTFSEVMRSVFALG
jgi:type II secretory ATPase GspE/PulE/Tfp pilus assembly ATPase PilB-like protein